jgi:hypothetical protein
MDYSSCVIEGKVVRDHSATAAVLYDLITLASFPRLDLVIPLEREEKPEEFPLRVHFGVPFDVA